MLGRARVLIIDEDRRTVDRLQEMFVRAGYEAEIALSPSVGMSIINERQMSVAVLNADLGRQQNWEVVRLLRGSDPKLPLVLFNAPKMKGLLREAKRFGVRRLLVTPVDFNTVYEEALKAMRN